MLGRVLRRVEADFEARYHYRPWLVETFVAPEHDGACLRAANFVCVGPTAGRGRCDRAHERARTTKSVYMYELASHWRRTLGVARVEAAPSLGPAKGSTVHNGHTTSSEAPRWETSACRRDWCEARSCSHRVRAMCSPAPRTARQ